jgi:hypothetical protein
MLNLKSRFSLLANNNPLNQVNSNLENSISQNARNNNFYGCIEALSTTNSQLTASSGLLTTPNFLKQVSVNNRSDRDMTHLLSMTDNKRTRNMFTQSQIDTLERVFEQTHYPDSSIRENLSLSLNLSVPRIQVWFQNRRAKFRKLDVMEKSSVRKYSVILNKKGKFF